jgi:nickel transport protein
MMRCTAFALALLAASNASAHSLNIFVRDEGGVIKGNAYFTGGTPAQDVAITVSNESGSEFGRTTTDDEGNFTYTGARPAGINVFVASTPDGHRAEVRLGSVAAAESRPQAVPANTASMKSYEAELTDIHAAIDKLENRLWLRDVIGGIGYIFGLAGFWALWKARASRKAE